MRKACLSVRFGIITAPRVVSLLNATGWARSNVTKSMSKAAAFKAPGDAVSQSGPLLRLNQVAKSFGAVRALKGVSFDLQPGEVHALVGENGAGKSTLIRIITGAHWPDRGSLEINGVAVKHLTPAVAH